MKITLQSINLIKHFIYTVTIMTWYYSLKLSKTKTHMSLVDFGFQWSTPSKLANQNNTLIFTKRHFCYISVLLCITFLKQTMAFRHLTLTKKPRWAKLNLVSIESCAYFKDLQSNHWIMSCKKKKIIEK